jgi:hypothetical protein
MNHELMYPYYNFQYDSRNPIVQLGNLSPQQYYCARAVLIQIGARGMTAPNDRKLLLANRVWQLRSSKQTGD